LKKGYAETTSLKETGLFQSNRYAFGTIGIVEKSVWMWMTALNGQHKERT